jgi:hypothetical protein
MTTERINAPRTAMDVPVIAAKKIAIVSELRAGHQLRKWPREKPRAVASIPCEPHRASVG